MQVIQLSKENMRRCQSDDDGQSTVDEKKVQQKLEKKDLAYLVVLVNFAQV